MARYPKTSVRRNDNGTILPRLQNVAAKSDLVSLRGDAVSKVASNLLGGTVLSLSREDTITYLEERFAIKTINGAIHRLKAKGEIPRNKAEANAMALGNGPKPPANASAIQQGVEAVLARRMQTINNATRKAPAVDKETVRQEVVRVTEEFFDNLTKDLVTYKAEVRSIAASNKPVQVTFVMPEKPQAPVQLERKPHAAFTKILCLVRAGLNVAMTGPAGSGKTTIAEDMAKVLGRPYAMIPATSGASEASVIGRLLPLGEGGTFRWLGSPFTCRFAGEKVTFTQDGPVVIPCDEEAGVFLIDEADAMDPNVAIVFNSALANGSVSIEQRLASGLDPVIRKHPNAVVMAAMNTFGTGMDLLYAGRNALDAAFLDRWYPVYVGYDPALEARIGGYEAPASYDWTPDDPPTEQELQNLAKWVLRVRAHVEQNKFKRVVGTRMMQKALAARKAGIPTQEVKSDLLAAWKPGEKEGLL